MGLWQRRLFGILSLGGGAIGLVQCVMHLLATHNRLAWLLFGLFTLIYAWGLWCGVWLLENRAGAPKRAFWFWLLQVPVFSSPLFGYFFAAGFHATLTLGFAPLDVHFSWLLGSSFNIAVLQKGSPWLIGVNLFALFASLWLGRYRR